MEKINESKALVIVDVQYDFLPGGALAVSEGDEIIPVINELQEKFDLIIATQDWHPESHQSFASSHLGKTPGDLIDLHGLDQILWPDHCVHYTKGAQFAAELNQTSWDSIFQKGKNPEVDSYSGFFDNARRGDTGLGDYLQSKGVKQVYIVGLAQDYCVKFTALDSQSLGFETYLVTDATRPVNLSEKDGDLALNEMKTAGIHLIESGEL
ncbi:bifunctional nicotinamidase/pyrazinamidase [Algoriphagus vanfongensis]|uniref:bifunctional nicotinamidase/pyrazinamidase n=1 Tax=Algoriphagus vanfongensis TaxID=426371 RepID=UPI0004020A57|nr:bifunctional nicotinamidase/pyrazinamidase [Algoriphagus vanfongensis]